MIKSRFKELKTVTLPEFSDTRVLMLPFLMEDIESLPNDLVHYKQTVQELVAISPEQRGVAYLTIDEKFVKTGESHRLKGLHIDGYGTDGRNEPGIWARNGLVAFLREHWDEANQKWFYGAAGIGGMITVANPAGCRAWYKDFEGAIGRNGDCENLREQFPDSEGTVFQPNMAYWCNASCVHESLPMSNDIKRTFVRLSMPSKAPWYAGYTKNPKGILPTGTVVHSTYYRSGEPEVILKG